VVKVGSDVEYLMREIIPRVPVGVHIHIHDVLWPFEYPEAWLRGGRAWNEAYAVMHFLQFNKSFQIDVFNSFLSLHHPELFADALPDFLSETGGSLWLRRIA